MTTNVISLNQNGGGGEESQREFWRLIGAVGFSNQLTESLSAQNLRALDHIKREKLYLAGGYQTFDDFLDHCTHSPMKSETYRRRWNLLQGESDDTFNLLTSLKVPLETRKLLAGEIEVIDNEIRIGDATTRLDDNPRIIELISKLHHKTVEQQRTIERGKKDVEKLKRRADDAEKRVSINPDDFGQALLMHAGSGARLVDLAVEASEEERAALRDSVFEVLSSIQLRLGEVLYEKKKPASVTENLGVTDEEAAELLGD